MNHKSPRKSTLSFPIFLLLNSTKNIDWFSTQNGLWVTQKAHSMLLIHSLPPIAITDPGITFYFLIHISLPELIHLFTDSRTIITQSIICSDIKLRTKPWTQPRAVRGPVNVAWKDSITFTIRLCFCTQGLISKLPSYRSFLEISAHCSFSIWFVLILNLVINRNSPMILAHNQQKDICRPPKYSSLKQLTTES